MKHQEAPAREPVNFSELRKNHALEALFQGLSAEGKREVLERARKKARERLAHEAADPSTLIGFRLAVLRARNEILETEVGLPQEAAQSVPAEHWQEGRE